MDQPMKGEIRTDGEVAAAPMPYRPPYCFDALLAFFGARVIEGVEHVEAGVYTRVARMTQPDGSDVCGWVRVKNDAGGHVLVVTMNASLLPVASQVRARTRHQFDLDCDPHAVFESIASLDDTVPGAAVPGTRLPGCFDSFEMACRAILGQQVTVKAANRFAARMATRCGKPVDVGVEGLTHAFPTPAEVLAFDDVEGVLGSLGIIGSRSRTIAEIARLIEAGQLDMEPGADIGLAIEALQAIKGIGPWSANYIAMRTMGYHDAFLETDSGIAHALPALTPKERLKLAEQWRPWRSYANICLWNSLSGA